MRGLRHGVEGRDTFRARDVGHPLIPDERRVGNDVEVGPPGSFLLVTGSNMSGKTTLIRAVGANAVLAGAGGPVCARELTMPPVRLATSIVVEDSLEEGVSFFMAELLRLKAWSTRRRSEGDGGRHGGRLLAGRGPPRHQQRRAPGRDRTGDRAPAHLGAIGAVTTHDLEILAEGELEPPPCRSTSGRRSEPRPEGGADMTFDFIARPGLAPTTNALRLLEAVGLAPEGTPEDGEHEETGR